MSKAKTKTVGTTGLVGLDRFVIPTLHIATGLLAGLVGLGAFLG